MDLTPSCLPKTGSDAGGAGLSARSVVSTPWVECRGGSFGTTLVKGA
jgi:hypothetical protein